MIRKSLDNLKNIWGWRTSRKIVVLSVDDYGNVRLDGRKARAALERAGMKELSRFDVLDSLETREDLEMLFDSLTSVRDKNHRHAVFSPFAVPCNIDFESIAENGWSGYEYETLPATFEKMSARDPRAYENTWKVWEEGLAAGLLVPQFHGREHLNLKVFEEKLAARDGELMTCLENRSYSRISDSGYPTIGCYTAFDFWDIEENRRFKEVVRDGLDAFECVFGYRAVQFNPPGGRENHLIHQSLCENGIRFIDSSLVKREHQGRGRYRRSLNWTGKSNGLGAVFCVRNVVFEPTDNRGFDWIGHALSQVEAAFRWNRPAIISSHRVNFCGHLSPENRKTGLAALRSLLKGITTRWPDSEFMSSTELMNLVGAG